MKLKIISLNVWQGGNLLESVVDFLKTEDADIVLLQEVYDVPDPKLVGNYRTMAVLRKALGYAHDTFAIAYLDDSELGKLPHGNAIFSKFPIHDPHTTFLTERTQEAYLHIPENFSVFPRILQEARLETPAGDVYVFNIHGVWDMDGDNDSTQRQHMVSETMARMADKPRVILAGDTNAKSSNPAMQLLKTTYTSVFDDLPTTFNMRRKTNPGYAMAPVDHMYLGHDVKLLGADCPDIDISDHLPLIATVEV